MAAMLVSWRLMNVRGSNEIEGDPVRVLGKPFGLHKDIQASLVTRCRSQIYYKMHGGASHLIHSAQSGERVDCAVT